MGIRTTWNNTFEKTIPNFLLRYFILFLGLFILAFSVALSRKSGLGTSPISCVPCVLGEAFPALTIGEYTFIFNTLLVLFQIALLRRSFEPIQLLQLVIVFFFSWFIDLSVIICDFIPIGGYLEQWAWCALSFFLTALGVFLEVKAAVIFLPGEGTVTALKAISGKEFSKLKIAFDSTLVISGVIISLATMGALVGVREGTVVGALCIGAIVGLLKHPFAFVERMIPQPIKTAEVRSALEEA